MTSIAMDRTTAAGLFRPGNRAFAAAAAALVALGLPWHPAVAADPAAQIGQAAQEPAKPAAPGAVSAPDRSSMSQAADAGLYEVEVSKMVAARTGNADVKDYAAMLVKHHGEANGELRQLAARKSVPLAPEITADKKARIDALKGLSGDGFDRAYIERVGVQDHEADIRLFESIARDAGDADLKAFAEKTLPVLKEHLKTARMLANNRRQASDPAQPPE